LEALRNGEKGILLESIHTFLVKGKTTWDLLASIFIIADMLIVPFQLCLEAPAGLNSPIYYLQLCAMTYWTVHCCISLMPGLQGKNWSQKFARVVAYLRSYFLLDLAINLLDYGLFYSQQSANSTSPIIIWLRLLRLLRILRLKKVMAVERDFEDGLAFRGYEVLIHFLTLLKSAVTLAFAGHFFGCLWALLGLSSSTSWLNDSLDDTPTKAGDIYAIAVHFTLGFLTGAPVDCIFPVNNGERIFTFFLMMLSLLVLGYGVAQVQQTLTELTRMSAEEQETRRRLQGYLCRIQAPLDMCVRIVTFAMNTYRRTRTTNLDSSLSDLLSHRLLSEMTVIQRQDDLKTHPFFEFFEHMHKAEFNLVCNAIVLHRHEEFETVFEVAGHAKCAYYIAHGNFKLTPSNDELDPVTYSVGKWLCEIALFMKYNHTSTLLSLTYTETLQLSMEDFIICVKNSPPAIALVYAYGTEFLNTLQSNGSASMAVASMSGPGGGGINDDVPIEQSAAACKTVKELSGKGDQHDEEGEGGRIAVSSDPEVLDKFSEVFLKLKGEEAADGSGIDEDEAKENKIIEEIPKVFAELNKTNGFYALARESAEAMRCTCSMLNLIWLYRGRYERFTFGQAEKGRLTMEQWEELRGILEWSEATEEEISALLVFLAIRGMGKVKSVVNLLPEAHRTPEKAVSYIIDKAPQMVPSFCQLSIHMQELVKEALTVHDHFNFGQMLQGENLPSHIQELQTYCEQHGQDVLKFYLLSTLGIFSGILGPKNVNGSLFMNSANAAKVMRGIECLQHLTTSTPVSIYWHQIEGYAKSLDYPIATAEDMLLARLACILRAANKADYKLLQDTWSELNSHDRFILEDKFLADGVEHQAFFFAFLPQYFDNARKNSVIGLKRAMLLLVDLIVILRAGSQDENKAIKVDLSELVALAKSAEDSTSFDQFLERVVVESLGKEMRLTVRNRAEKGSFDAKLDIVAQGVRQLRREIHNSVNAAAASLGSGSGGQSQTGANGVASAQPAQARDFLSRIKIF
jgi:hypothetical protein